MKYLLLGIIGLMSIPSFAINPTDTASINGDFLKSGKYSILGRSDFYTDYEEKHVGHAYIWYDTSYFKFYIPGLKNDTFIIKSSIYYSTLQKDGRATVTILKLNPEQMKRRKNGLMYSHEISIIIDYDKGLKSGKVNINTVNMNDYLLVFNGRSDKLKYETIKKSVYSKKWISKNNN